MHLETKVRIAGGRVPRRLTEEIVRHSLAAAGNHHDTQPREVLFHLAFDLQVREWRLLHPEQLQTATSVKPRRRESLRGAMRETSRPFRVALSSHAQNVGFLFGTTLAIQSGDCSIKLSSR